MTASRDPRCEFCNTTPPDERGGHACGTVLERRSVPGPSLTLAELYLVHAELPPGGTATRIIESAIEARVAWLQGPHGWL